MNFYLKCFVSFANILPVFFFAKALHGLLFGKLSAIFLGSFAPFILGDVILHSYISIAYRF